MYKPELLKVQEDRKKAKEAAKAENMARLMKDMKVSQPLTSKGAPKPKASTTEPTLHEKPKKRTPQEILKALEEQERQEEQ